jgi:rhodanese-related sulfurtransferase
MSHSLVQVNYSFSGSRAAYEEMTRPMAGPMAETPGLCWKVWLMNEAKQEAGGICLFDSQEAAQAFAREVAALIESELPFHSPSIKQFEVLEGHSMATRGLPRHPRTFGDMAAEAMVTVPVVDPGEAQRRLQADSNLLVIDVRDAADIEATGTIPGAVNISYGALTYQADHEVPETWRAPQLADRSRPIITTCILGPLGALGGRLLHDMGFTDVSILAGGVQSWIDAGLPVSKNGAS